MSRAALALILAATPAVAHAARGKLAFSLLAGGGYASDVFIGAGLGPDALLQLTPAGRLDLSLGPAWKLAALADATYGVYLSSGFSSLAESAALEGRWIAGESCEASLAASGEHASYSLGAPIDPNDPSSPSVVSTVAARVSPLLRLRALGFEWRAAGLAGTRSSTGPAGEDIPESDYALLLGFMHPLHASLTLAVTYKLGRVDSTRPDFAFTSHALFALLSWPLGKWDLQAHLQLQTASFETGFHEDLGRLTLGVAHPLTESVDVEAVYSFAGNLSNDPSRPSASRHFAFLALRWRFAEVLW